MYAFICRQLSVFHVTFIVFTTGSVETDPNLWPPTGG
jgi:hypothetical protein